jgi:hypothetical protein
MRHISEIEMLLLKQRVKWIDKSLISGIITG